MDHPDRRARGSGGAPGGARGLAARAQGAASRIAASIPAAPAERVERAVSGAAARAGLTARSALPGGLTAGRSFRGTVFQRRLATALATRPHARSTATKLLGSSPLRTGTRAGWRAHQALADHGFDAASSAGGPDADELVHIHGRRLPVVMDDTRSLRRRGRAELAALSTGRATGSLHRVTVSEADRARGATDWDRLCVDAEAPALLRLFPDHHLDVLIAPWAPAPADEAGDLRLLLPQGVPPQVWAALTDSPGGPGPHVSRLHLLGGDRVGVDHGDRVRLFTDVVHTMRGSLVVTGGRVSRAELWITDRRNIMPSVLDFVGDLFSS